MTDRIPAIDVKTLARMRQRGEPHALLDVREPDELAICSLEGSLHVPMGSIPRYQDRLPADRPIVVMCHHGARSLHVAARLRQAGLDAWNLTGGIDAWSQQVDPTTPRY